MENVVQMFPKTELTDEQKIYWWKVLEDAERQAEYARKMLGQIAMEGLEE